MVEKGEENIRVPTLIKTSIIRSSVEDEGEGERNPGCFDILPNSHTLMLQCLICLNKYPPDQMVTLSQCGHSFCTSCLQAYLFYKVEVMERPRCPEEGCPHLVGNDEQVQKMLPEGLKPKFQRMKLWLQTVDNPDLKLCPSQSCKGIVRKKDKLFQCDTCLTEYCSECMYVRHEGRCDINFQKNYRLWKKCPKCKIFISKDQGCNHMTCTACHYQFCMLCLKSWQAIHNCVPYDDPLLVGVIDPDNIVLATPCKRRIKGLLMLILSPFMLVGLILLAVLLLAALLLGGFLCSPCIAKDVCGIPALVSILFYPVIGTIMGVTTMMNKCPRALANLADFSLKYFRSLRAYLYYEDKDEDNWMEED